MHFESGCTDGGLSWAAAGRPLAGEVESGDQYLVKDEGDKLLVAVIDGLGHGSEAAEAARVGIAMLDDRTDGTLPERIKHCHEAMRCTRGGVLSLACIRPSEGWLEWLGIGNVEGLLVRGDESEASMPLRGGILGHVLPSLHPVRVPIAEGDTLIMATDGISASSLHGVDTEGSPSEIALRILSRLGREADDALVVVVLRGKKNRD